MADTVLSQQGEPLDLIVWRHRGTTSGFVEAALDANPGLADRGPTLPGGVEVALPAAASAKPQRETVQLWT